MDELQVGQALRCSSHLGLGSGHSTSICDEDINYCYYYYYYC